MATAVIMPKIGISVENCVITKWHKKPGDKVEEGDLLFSFETDKSTLDEQAKASGILLETFYDEGDEVPCLSTVCVIGQPDEDISNLRPKKNEESPALQKEETPVVNSVAAEDNNENEIIKISPRARNLAKKNQIEYTNIPPTGAEGRIVERDIRDFIDNRASSAYTPPPESAANSVGTKSYLSKQESYQEIELSSIRKLIAKSMVSSLSNMAQLTLHSSFDATEILKFRDRLKRHSEEMGLASITINDIILFAVSRTLLNHRGLNAHLIDNKIRYFDSVNLGIAVDTEKGLIVPTLFGADKLSLSEISAKAKELISSCQSGSINPDLLKGAGFTVTNLGSLGIESFTPIINPPQTGILGVNKIETKIREVNGEIVGYPSMGLSLTFDHRAIDGAPAARFLKELVTNLEHFNLLLAK